MFARAVSKGLIVLAFCGLAAVTAHSAVFAEPSAGSFFVAINVVSIEHDTTSSSFNVTVSPAPASDVTLTISLGGTVGAEASLPDGNALTFGPAGGSRTFRFRSGLNIGSIVFNFSLSGTNAADYATPASHTVQVIGKLTLSPASPATMTAGSSATYTVTASRPVLNNLTISLNPSVAGSVSPASLAFPAGATERTFTVTAAAPGSIGVSFFRSGADAFRYSSMSPLNITVIAANTAAGSNVTVTPAVPPGLPLAVTVTYPQVTSPGMTTLSTVATPPAAPSGFAAAGGGLYFSVSTTAAVVTSAASPTIVCAKYAAGVAADESSLRLMRSDGASWTDITSHVDPNTHVICGNSAFATGPFAIFTLNAAPVTGAIAGPSLVAAGASVEFSATFTDANSTDVHSGTWVWGDNSTSPAVITNENGVWTAKGEHAFATAGPYQVALVISDGAQQSRSPDFAVAADGADPEIQSVTATPGVIWPPNGRMHDVVVSVAATDDTGTPVCSISGVDMPGISASDFTITGDLTLQLRAVARRSYVIGVTCTDGLGRTAHRTVSVSVENPKRTI